MDILLILLIIWFFKFDFKMALYTLLFLISLGCFVLSLSKLNNIINTKERERQFKRVVFYGILLGIFSLIFTFTLITTYFKVFVSIILISILLTIIKMITNRVKRINNENNKKE